jgi:alkylation response protein AidB-like acyl-CoA dehydrogenase
MDFELPEDIVTLREVVRKFAAEEIRPHARDWDREQNVPDSLVRSLGAMGLLARSRRKSMAAPNTPSTATWRTP